MAIIAKHLVCVVDKLVAKIILPTVPTFAPVKTRGSPAERTWAQFNIHDSHPLEWQIFVAEAHLFAEISVCQLRLLLLLATFFGASQVFNAVTCNLGVP